MDGSITDVFSTIGCSYHAQLNVFKVVVVVVVVVLVMMEVGCKNVMRQGWDSNPCGQIFTPIGIAQPMP